MIPHLLLPDPSLIHEGEIIFRDDDRSITMEIAVLQPTASCPLCCQEASRIHSHYSRSLADLPWADIGVRIELRVRRFYCDHPDCLRKIFCERVPATAAPWARRTRRLAAAQAQIGLRAGGSDGARLCVALHMPAGIDVLLGLIRTLVCRDGPTPKVLGVDDWAMHKGYTYGTILVDLEQGCIVDLLPDRKPETLAQWLRAHPGIEVVSRDRAEAYAEGIRQGAPAAIQVADRWHLLHNLAETLHKIFQQQHNVVESGLRAAEPAQAETATASGQLGAQAEPNHSLNDTERPPSAADQRRGQRVEMRQQLRRQGWTQIAIAAHLGLSAKTVRRYLNTSLPLSPQRRGRVGTLEPYKSYLIERWNSGCHNAAQLWREIRSQGFTGQMTTVRSFITLLRRATGLPPRTRGAVVQPLAGDPTRRKPTLRELTWLVLRQPDTLEAEEKECLSRICAVSPEINSSVRLAREFAEMVRQRQADKLEGWLNAAAESGISRLNSFAAGLRRDGAAVLAALSLPWSNGPTEGHINRLKCVKRQMYGRAKLDLLSQRLLAT